MFDRGGRFLFGNQGTGFGIGFVIVTTILVSASLWVLQFVRGEAMVLSPIEELGPTAGYTEYTIEPSADYLEPESLAAMATYIAANPEPQNVQVLTGLSTAQIAGYMVKYQSGGLRVDCSYCHNVQNFASDEKEEKIVARQMLVMTADLNQNWLTQLDTLSENKHPAGKQITCATCHNGLAQFQPWPDDQNGLPDNYRLPLEDLSVLRVTGQRDVSLDTVQYNQYTMYHMNVSLGIGCTHCHNARYFPSFERPAKLYALTMLNMAQHINEQYGAIMGGQEPSCNMCHQGNILPPGSANADADIPDVIGRPETTTTGATDDAAAVGGNDSAP